MFEWKKVSESKPDNMVEVLGYSKDWIDEFNPEGIRVGFWNNNGFVSSTWCSEYDCFISISVDEVRKDGNLHDHEGKTEPEYWTEKPKGPDKQEYFPVSYISRDDVNSVNELSNNDMRNIADKMNTIYLESGNYSEDLGIACENLKIKRK